MSQNLQINYGSKATKVETSDGSGVKEAVTRSCLMLFCISMMWPISEHCTNQQRRKEVLYESTQHFPFHSVRLFQML